MLRDPVTGLNRPLPPALRRFLTILFATLLGTATGLAWYYARHPGRFPLPRPIPAEHVVSRPPFCSHPRFITLPICRSAVP